MMIAEYRESIEGAGLGPYDLGLAEGLLRAAEIAERERKTILDNPSDPSWTEHLANVSKRCCAEAMDIAKMRGAAG